ncbi:MAG: Type 1 glutamine amidotransferase-like domain-containing protein [Desulfobacteraceae bacterium]|jgi:peptidase E
MKTKYVLHGGSAQHVNAENDKFFTEILNGAGDRVRILLVEFAGSDERKERNVAIDTSQFERVKGSRELTFEVADRDIFLNQIRKADVVYLGGGTTVRLVEVLNHYPELRVAFEGKIIAGESAGANVMATYCYSKSGGGVMKGLGLVPVKMWPHYKEERNEEFESISRELESLLLKDCEYRVFEI